MHRLLIPQRLSLLPIVLCCAAAALAQGFGSMKSKVTLHRKLPAVFNLSGTAVEVKVTSTAAGSDQLVNGLVPLIESTLQSNDHRITIDKTKPETLIACVVTGYVPSQIQQLTRNNMQVSESKLPFGKKTQRQAQQPYQKITGQLTVSYKAIDAKTAKPLDAGIIEAKINEDYEIDGSKTGSFGDTFNKFKKLPSTLTQKHEAEEAIPATTAQVDELLLKQIAASIGRRVVNTDEQVEVMLAKGKLEQAAKLGESNLWPRMLEEIDTIQPFPTKEEESYRDYNRGVAYEAMGYGAPDYKQAVKLFGLAAINYGKAIDNNPQEKYFRAPQRRIETALVTMRTLEDRGKVGVVTEAAGKESKPEEKQQAAQTGGDAKPVKVGDVAAADPDLLTNASLIDLKKSGIDDANLIENIREAKRFDFDLSLTGQKQLMQGGISNTVLGAIRQKVKGSVKSPASPRPATPAASSKTALARKQ